jgi:hypothetical protein
VIPLVLLVDLALRIMEQLLALVNPAGLGRRVIPVYKAFTDHHVLVSCITRDL